MAGWGSRLRPHTLTVPKPMLRVAGKPIVQWLVTDLVNNSNEKINEITFIIRADFGKHIELELQHIAKELNCKVRIGYQEEPLGTAHAILCAQHALNGKVIIGFADTIFKADFILLDNIDGVIWTKKVDDPSAFGVVVKNEKGHITNFVEKPKNFVSDEAIIGVYYFKDGENLRSELQFLLDNDIKQGGEYQLTQALDNMKNKGKLFTTGVVNTWLDCGNKIATVDTNQQMLNFINKNEIHSSVKLKNATIIQPCFIDENTELENCVIGPHVSIGKQTKISNSIISNSIIQDKTSIRNAVLANSMIGSQVTLHKSLQDVSLGDYSSEVQ